MGRNASEVLKPRNTLRPFWRNSVVGRRIYDALEQGFIGTRKEIAEKVHCSLNIAGEYLRQMHGEGDGCNDEKVVHIKEWRRSVRGHAAPVWAFGNNPDSPQLKPLTSEELSKRYAENLKKKLTPKGMRALKSARRKGSTQLILEGKVIWRKGEGIVNQVTGEDFTLL